MNLQEQTNRIKQMMGLITETSEEEAYELLKELGMPFKNTKK